MRSRLLEIAIKNSIEREEAERHNELDLSSSNILAKSLANMQRSSLSPLPVEPEESTWEEVEDFSKTYLQKDYVFEQTKHMMYFINESLRQFDKMNHHAKLTVEHLSINVQTYTHDVNNVTKQDMILTDFFDEIFEDITYLDDVR